MYADCTQLNSMLERYPGLFEVIVIDCETTGLHHKHRVNGHDRNDYVLQLSIISAHTGMKIYDGYFKPKIKSWPEAESINHISPDFVKDKPTFAAERKKIQEIISAARVIIGYNVFFDIGFLENSGITFEKCRYFIDVMEDYSVYHGDLNPFYHSFTWQSLVKAANRAGFEWEKYPPHNSLADVAATLHVAKWLQERHIEDGWIVYYPPCKNIMEEFYCDQCKLPCRLRDRARVNLHYDKEVKDDH